MDFQLPSQQLQVLLFDKSKVCPGTPRTRPLCHLLHRATRLVIPGCYHTHGGLGDVENCNLLTDTQIDTKLPTPCLEMGRDTLVGLDTGYNGIHWCPTPCLKTAGHPRLRFFNGLWQRPPLPSKVPIIFHHQRVW